MMKIIIECRYLYLVPDGNKYYPDGHYGSLMAVSMKDARQHLSRWCRGAKVIRAKLGEEGCKLADFGDQQYCKKLFDAAMKAKKDRREIMNIDKMREEFETFREKRNAQLESEGHKPGSKWHVTNAHYPTWQASREALVIQLPNRMDGKYCRVSGFDELAFSADVLRAIEAAGVKVKS